MPARARSPAWRRPWVGALEIALVLALPGLCGACDAPPRYQSMKIKGDSKSSYSPGERVDYECRPGYKRDFTLPAHTVCNDDGTWAALQEACTKKACPHPPVPSNGEISSPQGDLLFGSEVHYTCFVGFRLIGSKVIYCEVFDNTMKWSDQPPLCESSKPTPATTTPTSGEPGPKPAVTTLTPASRDPGDVRPSDQPPETSGHLGPGVIAVIVLSTVVGVMLASLGVYKYLQSRKKRETKNSEASFSTYRSKSSSPTEESN
ncbi:membrane cofactor protein-like [Sorex fumeus]|uniref:membrane cofactor protein-like n=1 Tax=Sorex fumeus TaxID=62283 RepID=UPI0024ACBDD2|nr:membrane cofactor protein-like [Sorex fumeus]